MKVLKFGGSSVSSSGQFKKVKKIVEADIERTAVVVSAIGKADKDDTKITDLLYLLHAHIRYNVSYDNIFEMIKSRFVKVKEELQLQFDVSRYFDDLKETLSKETTEDYIVSRGENLTAILMAEYLGYHFVDSKDVIKFNYDGTINYEITDELIKQSYQSFKKVVIPGFYGSYPNGEVKVFSRGGSDITGSLVSRALNAEVYENWTDVSGIMVTDPRIVENPKRIKEITYTELRELSYMGANVLHEETIFPVRNMNIPIHILNTNAPNDEGTYITENCCDNSNIITGIAGKKHFTSVTITKTFSANKTSIIKQTLEIFEKYGVVVEHIPSSIDTFSVVIESAKVEKGLYDICSTIKKIDGIEDVSIDTDIALVAVVGRNMATRIGISGSIFGLLGDNNINIKMIAQGAEEINIIVGVSNNDLEKAIITIYNNLVL